MIEKVAKMDFFYEIVIYHLNVRVKFKIEKSVEKKEFLQALEEIILEANEIKADAQPDNVSLKNVVEKYKNLGVECNALIAKIEEAKKNQIL